MDRFFIDRYDEHALPDPTIEPRHLWERRNVLIEMRDTDFKRNFRFLKVNFLKLVDIVHDDLLKETNRGTPLAPFLQVALMLAYMANGSFQHVCGVIIGASKTTAHVVIHRVMESFMNNCHGVISLPTETEMRDSAENIFRRFGLPNIPLGVDGTFIRLGKKPLNAELMAEDGRQTVFP